MLSEYINWENVQKYHIISDIVEGGGTKWKVSTAIKFFLIF